MVSVAVEGYTDVPVVKRVFDLVGLEIGPVYGQKGKGWLDKHARAYNAAAMHARWLLLRDLDHDADCAPVLVKAILPAAAHEMRLRIAVRATEAWLLADREKASLFLGVARSKIPHEPESIPDPKSALVNLATRSRIRAIREDMAPAAGTSASVGPNYAGRLIEFALGPWRPEVAAERSDSLHRCIETLREWVA